MPLWQPGPGCRAAMQLRWCGQHSSSNSGMWAGPIASRWIPGCCWEPFEVPSWFVHCRNSQGSKSSRSWTQSSALRRCRRLTADELDEVLMVSPCLLASTPSFKLFEVLLTVWTAREWVANKQLCTMIMHKRPCQMAGLCHREGTIVLNRPALSPSPSHHKKVIHQGRAATKAQYMHNRLTRPKWDAVRQAPGDHKAGEANDDPARLAQIESAGNGPVCAVH